MKIKFWQFLLPIILGGMVFYYFIYRDKGISLGFKNLLWIIYGSMIIVIWWIIEGLKLSMLARYVGENIKLLDSLKVIFTGFFLGGITVFSIGTFPGEYVSLLRLGVDVDKALWIVSVRGIMNSIIKGIVAIVIAIFLRNYGNSMFRNLLYSIFLTYGLGILLVYFIIFSKNIYAIKIRGLITKGLIYLEKRYMKLSSHIYRFRVALISQAGMSYVNSFYNWLLLFSIYILSCIILLSFPIFIVRSIGASIRLTDTIIAQAIFYITQSYMPTPGGSGIVELGYDYFLKNISGVSSAEFIMLLRLFTFYLPVLIGGFMSLSLVNRRRMA
ncbi:MAG: flippase-like domain-containing protein [bacterium]|nr:flippase-like domain-containing protein [bacterium]